MILLFVCMVCELSLKFCCVWMRLISLWIGLMLEVFNVLWISVFNLFWFGVWFLIVVLEVLFVWYRLLFILIRFLGFGKLVKVKLFCVVVFVCFGWMIMMVLFFVILMLIVLGGIVIVGLISCLMFVEFMIRFFFELMLKLFVWV